MAVPVKLVAPRIRSQVQQTSKVPRRRSAMSAHAVAVFRRVRFKAYLVGKNRQNVHVFRTGQPLVCIQHQIAKRNSVSEDEPML
jgi:hypothetical protein